MSSPGRRGSLGATAGEANMEMREVTGHGVPSSSSLRRPVHPKKNDDAYGPLRGSRASPATATTPYETRDAARPVRGSRTKPAMEIEMEDLDLGGAGTPFLSPWAVYAAENAHRLGTERVVLMLLAALTVITGTFCALSAAFVFYNNYLFITWKSHRPRGTANAPVTDDSGSGDVTMPALPTQILSLEHALWRLGLPAIMVGVLGVLAAQHLRMPKLLYLYIILGLIFAFCCFHKVVVASASHYLRDGEEELSIGLQALWSGLSALPDRGGHGALCDLQTAFRCTGYSVCCLTNSTPLGEDVLDRDSAVWDEICFLSYPNGTKMDRAGLDVTEVVGRECTHMLAAAGGTSTDHLDGNPVSSSVSPASDFSEAGSTLHPASESHQANLPSTEGTGAHISEDEDPESDDSDDVSELLALLRESLPSSPAAANLLSADVPQCPIDQLITEGFDPDWMAPCREKLLGSLTTSLGFVLSALFTMATFSSVGIVYAISVARNQYRAGAVLASSEDDIAGRRAISVAVVADCA